MQFYLFFQIALQKHTCLTIVDQLSVVANDKVHLFIYDENTPKISFRPHFCCIITKQYYKNLS